jgi:divinyl protochlorophyllide a 8-vinyl-reductase
VTGSTTSPGGLVGPNTVIQAAGALIDQQGLETARAIFDKAGLSPYLATPPEHMIPEREARALFDAISGTLDTAQARGVLREAGRRTADYILANRIPSRARKILARLPRFASGRLLALAIGRHAWTFVGTGHVHVDAGRRIAFTIRNNPLSTPDEIWHRTVFERLFEVLLAQRFAVSHRHIATDAGDACEFLIAGAPQLLRAPPRSAGEAAAAPRRAC